MRPVPMIGSGPTPGTEAFLVYVQRFDIVPQINPSFSSRSGPFPDPASSMYLLKCSTRTDGHRLGDVVPLAQVREQVDITPNFGAKADNRLTKETSLEYSQEFWLNHYFDTEIFQHFSSSSV